MPPIDTETLIFLWTVGIAGVFILALWIWWLARWVGQVAYRLFCTTLDHCADAVR